MAAPSTLPNPERPSPERHCPERTCVACRRKRPQGEFVRVTRTSAGWRVLPGIRTGRGAYVCADSPDCWQEKRLRRAFRGDAPAVSAQLQALNTPMDQPMTT
ncbi:YlxR family protein [Deinococcus aluminii]|uniref:YlxR domain-containing protein n=1 Tax=Deinococcus aluminii TaxID=1656885 RepID=A0ABP9XBD4_9DEIO